MAETSAERFVHWAQRQKVCVEEIGIGQEQQQAWSR